MFRDSQRFAQVFICGALLLLSVQGFLELPEMWRPLSSDRYWEDRLGVTQKLCDELPQKISSLKKTISTLNNGAETKPNEPPSSFFRLEVSQWEHNFLEFRRKARLRRAWKQYREIERKFKYINAVSHAFDHYRDQRLAGLPVSHEVQVHRPFLYKPLNLPQGFERYDAELKDLSAQLRELTPKQQF